MVFTSDIFIRPKCCAFFIQQKWLVALNSRIENKVTVDELRQHVVPGTVAETELKSKSPQHFM